MAYGHAERNLAALNLLQRQIDQLLEQRARERERSGPAPQPDDSSADGARERQDPRLRLPVPPGRPGGGSNPARCGLSGAASPVRPARCGLPLLAGQAGRRPLC